MNTKPLKIFIILPSGALTSPVKGAIALANSLASKRLITFVIIKQPDTAFQMLDPRINRVKLYEFGKWSARLRELRSLLKKAGGRSFVCSISYCLSADMFNILCRHQAIIFSSVRGNLLRVYSDTYGILGKFIALFHLIMLSRMDKIIAMTSAMSEQIHRYSGRFSPIVRNFLNESSLEYFRSTGHRDGPYQFIYTGSLIKGKRPDILINAIRILQLRNIPLRLDIYGDGPLMLPLKLSVSKLPDPSSVTFHGFVQQPFYAIANADVLVLPSNTEGVSRSVMEALFLGIPCVVRDVDGSSELVKSGVNGELFNHDQDLPDTMLRVAKWSRNSNPFRLCILPNDFRQTYAASQLLRLVDDSMALHDCEDCV